MTGGGTAGQCTGEPGFLAYGEIGYLAQTKDLTLEFNKGSQTVVIKYGDQ